MANDGIRILNRAILAEVRLRMIKATMDGDIKGKEWFICKGAALRALLLLNGAGCTSNAKR